MTNQLRGVNLGGWLVLEKWITPSLFAMTNAGDEYTLMRHADGARRIERHRRTFITEKDFKWLAANGIDLVRIPVGYWLFKPVDGYIPAVAYLDRAMQWAERHGIKVLIDLHAARGSQNGNDHSGRIGQAEWFDNPQYQQQTIELLRQIAERYKDSPGLWGIELLNEPLATSYFGTLRRFYRQAYDQLCLVLRPGTHIVFHDGFQPLIFSFVLWARRSHPVVMDVHWYAFTSNSMDVNTYLNRTMLLRKLSLLILRLRQPVLIGEWSTMLPRHYLEPLPRELQMTLLGKHADMQRNTYKKATGVIYWTYKTEAGDMWSFRDMTTHGVLKP